MISPNLLLTFLLVSTGFINLALSMYLLKNKDTRASKLLSLTLLCAAAWAFFHAFEFYAPTELFTVRNKLKYLGIMPLPPFLLAFSLEYTGRKNWVTFKKIGSLFVIPAVNLFLLWTGLFQELSIGINSLNGDVYFIETWAFVLHSVYSYLLLGSAAALILYQLSRLHKSYRKHALILTLGILVPFAGNVVNLMGIHPFPGKFDITPALFTVSAIALTWGVSSFSFLDVIPVARKSVFENTKDAVMVLDGRNNLVDFNKAAKKLGEKGYIPKMSRDPWNTNLDEIFRKKAWLSEVEHDGSGKTVQLEGIEGERWYDVQTSPIYGEREELNAKIVTLRNVSERKVREKIEFLHSLLRHDVRNKSQLVLGYLEF